ncbi:MAG: von Willebrand factor type A domain-containing protein [Acidobacteria bacterium]|nr:von Willebrand factor type A domain-containing protein [Acidobacteriota bacterium]
MRFLLVWAFSALFANGAELFRDVVVEASEAAIANAVVTLTCGGMDRKTKTDSSGAFSFLGVDVRGCALKAESPGFRPFRVTNIPRGTAPFAIRLQVGYVSEPVEVSYIELNTENYRRQTENGFRHVKDHPLSTFSSDADTASYSNTRRFLAGGIYRLRMQCESKSF